MSPSTAAGISVLSTKQTDTGPSPVARPAYFGDLNLDQVVTAVTAGREEYDLAPFFGAVLHDPTEVRYRQAVLRDLDRDSTRRVISVFAQLMHEMRMNLRLARRVHHPLQRARLFLDSARCYCDAVEHLGRELDAADLASPGMLQLAHYAASTLVSAEHADLRDQTSRTLHLLGEVRYTLDITDSQVTIRAGSAAADASEDVLAPFGVFGPLARPDQPRWPQVPALLELDSIEAGILERVALLYPAVFEALTAFCARWPAFGDPALVRFDREVQFYLAYLDFIGPMRAVGLPFCLPRVTTGAATTSAAETFDVVLAARLAAAGQPVTVNDVRLAPPEQVLVVTGPNQGGKTTFARAFGQLHYLAGLGLLVPGRSAAVELADDILTQFGRLETARPDGGRLRDELIRLREILRRATPGSVIVLNEILTTVTASDAAEIGGQLLDLIADTGARCMCVTFLDELAGRGPRFVSIVAGVDPGNPARRTFKLTRRPADGLAYADSLASQHRLGYEQIRMRVLA